MLLSFLTALPHLKEKKRLPQIQKKKGVPQIQRKKVASEVKNNDTTVSSVSHKIVQDNESGLL